MALESKAEGNVVSRLAQTVRLPKMAKVKQLLDHSHIPVEDIPFQVHEELERSGMGFAFMEAFMDEVEVVSEPWKGTCVTMRKAIGGNADLQGRNHG